MKILFQNAALSSAGGKHWKAALQPVSGDI